MSGGEEDMSGEGVSILYMPGCGHSLHVWMEEGACLGREVGILYMSGESGSLGRRECLGWEERAWACLGEEEGTHIRFQFVCFFSRKFTKLYDCPNSYFLFEKFRKPYSAIRIFSQKITDTPYTYIMFGGATLGFHFRPFVTFPHVCIRYTSATLLCVLSLAYSSVFLAYA